VASRAGARFEEERQIRPGHAPESAKSPAQTPPPDEQEILGVRISNPFSA
jgi:hypothetical protein